MYTVDEQSPKLTAFIELLQFSGSVALIPNHSPGRWRERLPGGFRFLKEQSDLLCARPRGTGMTPATFDEIP